MIMRYSYYGPTNSKLIVVGVIIPFITVRGHHVPSGNQTWLAGKSPKSMRFAFPSYPGFSITMFWFYQRVHGKVKLYLVVYPSS